ncbi:hypothetical protein [Microbacterium alcoholitolerans]|uniref:hypothetical protein n=1 Tax=unclassified Microbacterium TaxID=2609290 RepID=UPI003D165545
MSFDNANATPGEQPHTDVPDAGRIDRELGWLGSAGAKPSPFGSAGVSSNETSDAPASAPSVFDAADDAVFYEDQVQPETGILGFTLRELVIVGAWLVAFIVSFFPVGVVGGSIWTSGIGWILPVGVPTAATFLVVLRRFSPEGIRRVGSLGIDQFASVAAAVAAVSWAQVLWSQTAATIETGMFLITWVTIVSLLATLVLVAATVAAPLIPRLRDDFEGRMETLAHRNANPVRPVIARPRPARPAPDRGAVADPAADAETAGAADAEAGADASAPRAEAVDSADDARAMPIVESDLPAVTGEVQAGAEPDAAGAAPEKDHHTDPVGVLEEIFADDSDATTRLPVVGEQPHAPDDDPDRTRPRHDIAPQPFWILAMTERDVLDEHGQPLFRIGPHAWTLVIEDRGGAYVVRHEDGRIGYLHDITDITKG